jgi:ABC-type Zn uptake system ZnuABC Zn-binding protein ZnuA
MKQPPEGKIVLKAILTDPHGEEGLLKRTNLIKFILSLLLAALAGMCLSGCGISLGNLFLNQSSWTPPELNPTVQPASLAKGQRLSVVTSTTILGDVISNLGGNRIDLVVLMKKGIDPHSYTPTPRDMAAIYDADVVFLNGAGLEQNMYKAIGNASGDAPIVQVSIGIPLRSLNDPSTNGASTGHTVEDPHVWFSVPNVLHWVDVITENLIALDPQNSTFYQANAASYRGQLKGLDDWIVSQVALIPVQNRKLITNHPVFGYFAERYGLEQLGAVYPINPSAEPSARDISALENAIREYKVPAVFTEDTVNPRLADQVAGDTGVKLAEVYTGSLGAPGSGADTYIGMVETDVNIIVSALR